MKKVLLFITILSCLVLNLNGQGSSGKDDLTVDNYLKSRTIVEKQKIISDTLAKVFNGTFYIGKTGYSSSEGDTWCSSSIIVVNAGKLIEFDSRTDSILPLLSLVKKEFIVKGANEAKIIETCLKLLYPPSEFSDEKHERIKIGNNWFFIRGTFFESKSGYIVSLDKSLRISNIAYSLRAIEK
jgi:hypothetical protein